MEIVQKRVKIHYILTRWSKSEQVDSYKSNCIISIFSLHLSSLVDGSFEVECVRDSANSTLSTIKLFKSVLELFNEQDDCFLLPRYESELFVNKLDEYRNFYTAPAGDKVK